MDGTRSARSMGGVMNVGYIPDSFGHIAMMPAILSGFGIDSALVYRGFGGEPGQTSSEYWWESPDGTRCLMVHLFRHGYSAGYFHQETEEEIVSRFGAMKAEARRPCGDLAPTDDERRRSPLARSETSRHAGSAPDDRSTGDFVHSTLPAYVDAVRKELSALPEVARRTPVRLPVCLRGARRRLLQQDVHQAGKLAMPEPAPALRRAAARHRRGCRAWRSHSRSCGMHGGP